MISPLTLLSGTTTDSTHVFSLEEALKLAEQNNHEIQKSMAEIKAARAENQQSNAAFLPGIELSNSITSSNDPLYAFGFKLQQRNLTMADFDPAVVNYPGTVDHFNTQVLVEQPLINVDAWLGKAAARQKLKATELKSAYTKVYVRYLVKQSYYALQLTNKRIAVIQKAKAAVEAYLQAAEENQEQGYLKDADVLAVKVRMLELVAQEKDAVSQRQNAAEMLNFLMGRDIHLPVQTSNAMEMVEITPVGNKSIALRSDVLAMEHGMNAYAKMKKSSLLKFAPRINAFGMYSLYDSKFPGTDADSWMVGIKLQWRVFNGGQNLGKYNKSKAEYEKARIAFNEFLEKGSMELQQATRTIEVAKSQLLTYELAAKQAKESLRIRSNRYEQGLERTSDLLMAEAKAAETDMKHLNALYNYNVAVFKYELLASESAGKQ